VRREGAEGRVTHRALNLLTIMTLAATGVMLLGFVAIALRPDLPINPYPPPTPSPTPAATATPTPAMATPTTIPPTPSATPVRPTPTPYVVATPTPPLTLTWPFTAEVEWRAAPTCQGSILAGTVSDPEGVPLPGYPVHIWSSGTETVTYSGTAARYGLSGWQVTFSAAGQPVTGTWYVQLHQYDYVRHHPPVSPIIRVEFTTDCQQNEARVRFHQRK